MNRSKPIRADSWGLLGIEVQRTSGVQRFPITVLGNDRVKKSSRLYGRERLLLPQSEPELESMAEKPKLHYQCARGRMEDVRWLLAAAGVEFEEQYIETKADLEKLRQDGSLLFQQVPMVEIDGMKMVQTPAILNYIATKYNLNGKDIKERALIDMYSQGAMDLGDMIMMFPFKPADVKEKELTAIIEKANNRYFPVFEKVLKDHGQDFLVGNQLSKADVQLLETILEVEELKADVLSNFPLLKAFKGRVSNIPTIKKFLQPGSPRKPLPDEKEIAEAIKIFY